MTLKQFTTIDGNKIIVNIDQVEYIDDDCIDGHICLNFMGEAPICVKGTLKSLMSWYQKQNKAKETKTVEMPQATFTPLYYKDGQSGSSDVFWEQPPKITC